jgi:hypothetical protein
MRDIGAYSRSYVMVWGMNLPNGYGEFWPEGDFEYDPKTRRDGWFERLRTYYYQQTPEERKRLFDYQEEGSVNYLEEGHGANFYNTFPVAKFKQEPGTLKWGVPCGPIEPHEAPRSWDTRKTYKSIASLIMLSSMILAVDEALKSIIERLEPGVHEFHPLEIRMPKGVVYPECYYTLRICQYFDAFSINDSAETVTREVSALYDPDTGELIMPAYIAPQNPVKSQDIAVHKAVFGSAHLWRDRFFKEKLVCFSDELMAEIEKAGLRIPKHNKMREV